MVSENCVHTAYIHRFLLDAHFIKNEQGIRYLSSSLPSMSVFAIDIFLCEAQGEGQRITFDTKMPKAGNKKKC